MSLQVAQYNRLLLPPHKLNIPSSLYSGYLLFNVVLFPMKDKFLAANSCFSKLLFREPQVN
jgi:hypothetical protein